MLCKTSRLHLSRRIKEHTCHLSSRHLSLFFFFLFFFFCSYGDRVEHFRVLEGGGQYCIWDESFCSLNRLVDFYRNHSIAVDEVVRLRDLPSPPRLQSKPGRKPCPNPYKSRSQESLPTAHLCPHPETGSSPCLLEPIMGV